MTFLDAPGPRWFTVAPHRPFLPDLARGLLDALPVNAPDEVSDAVLLVPTRRAAMSLAEAFRTASGGRPVLLPQIRALGDLEEGEPPFEPGDLSLDLPPEIGAYRRRFELARLVSDHDHLFGRTIDAPAALELADALGGFLDSLQLEEVDARDRIDSLVDEGLARHWQISSSFLKIAVEAWPRRLAELGLIDATDRRVQLLRALGRQWAAQPPRSLMVAAGSTGTTPANAALLAVIAAAPRGAVVLPGLDLELADEAWAEVGEQHPQGAMKRLIERAGIARGDVRLWPGSGRDGEIGGRWRRRIINEALRPAEATKDWLPQIERLREEGARAGIDPIALGLEGLSAIAARTEEQAADIAALLMREALEDPERTAALVTPDQALARRVSARLTRWGLTVDNTAGAPLASRPVGVLLSLIAGWAAEPADPVLLLAILKHPLVHLGLTPDAFTSACRSLEANGLRGPRPDGWDGLEHRLRAELEPDADRLPSEARVAEVGEAMALAARLREALELALEPYTGGTATPAEAARGLAQAAEALASDEAGKPGGLWAGSDGEAAVRLLSALINDSDGLPEAKPHAFAGVVDSLLAGETVRTTGAVHSRLKIMGAIEARLVSADRLILAGLEEGVWPRAAGSDPFLSRPMREQIGLPPPERRVGLSAHDFAQAASAPDVILLHAERREGAPSVQSRWLWRLDTLTRGAGVAPAPRPELLAWAQALDAPLPDPPPHLKPASRPEPRPPVESRPRKLSVTRIERWVRDPYAIYAEQILKLAALPPPDEAVEARLRGTAIHRALEELSKRWTTLPSHEAPEFFASTYIAELRRAGARKPSMAREMVLAARAADWICAFEHRRRLPGVQVIVEQRGETTLHAPGGDFRLSATADRIEVAHGRAHIIDLKTGRPPSEKEVRTGFSPQLSLTSAIVKRGGFTGVGPKEPGELLYVRLTGREPAGEEMFRGENETDLLAHDALEGVRALIDRFDSRTQPYRSRISPRFIKDYPGDFDHLARVREWSTGEEDAGE